MTGLDVLPLARVVNDGKVDDHHAIIPTGELPRGELSRDDRRVYDLVTRRFLAVFHPEARFEDTEVVTVAGGERFRTKGRRLLEAGWRGPAFGDEPVEHEQRGEEETEQTLPRIDDGRARHLRLGRGAREADQAARSLHRGLAAGRDGDGRQARSTTRSCARP